MLLGLQPSASRWPRTHKVTPFQCYTSANITTNVTHGVEDQSCIQRDSVLAENRLGVAATMHFVLL